MSTSKGQSLKHGSRSRYQRGCRCRRCVAANRAYGLRWMMDSYWRNRRLHSEPPTHGTLRGYQHFGCRCEKCTEANTAYFRNRRRKLREAA